MTHSHLLALVVVLLARSAFADRGAFSIDVGGGGSISFLRAPTYVAGPEPVPVTAGSAATIWVGARYGLENQFDLSASWFYEPPVPYYHAGASVRTTETDDQVFPGTLAHRLTRFGGFVGGRYVHGIVWRLSAGLELGVVRRVYSDVHHFNVSNPNGAADYRLNLPDFTVDNLALVPSAGVEWAFGDRTSVSVLSRLHVLVGRESSLALTFGVAFAYAWYL